MSACSGEWPGSVNSEGYIESKRKEKQIDRKRGRGENNTAALDGDPGIPIIPTGFFKVYIVKSKALPQE